MFLRDLTVSTSTQLHIISRVHRSLVVGAKDVGFIATRSAAPLHGRVEAARAIEVGSEAPRTAGRPDAVAARRLARARVLCEELLRPLAPT